MSKLNCVGRYAHEAGLESILQRIDNRLTVMRIYHRVVGHPFGVVKGWVAVTHLLT